MFKRSEERKCPRLKGYDYSKNGYYFITICVDDMEHRFGFVQNGIMNLNESGKIIKKYWFEMPNVFNNCILDEFIIMPNHIHCIIIIDNDNVVGGAYQSTPKQCNQSTPLNENQSTPKQCNQSTPFYVKKRIQLNIKTFKTGVVRWATPTEKIKSFIEPVETLTVGLKHHGISMMMRWFKSNTTKQINKLHPTRKFKWQRSFTDRIICKERELYYTRQYIRNNPENW